MNLQKIKQLNKEVYFDAVSKHLGNRGVDIQIISEELADEIEAQSWQLQGLCYDSKDDNFEVICEVQTSTWSSCLRPQSPLT